jgi:hypothetical protein
MPENIKKRQHMVQVLGNISYTMRYYQHLYWGSMGTREVCNRMALLYSDILNMLWK